MNDSPYKPPRIPRDPALTFGQMLAMVTTVGAVLYAVGYALWQGWH